MSRADVECVVVGAGVVGLASAYALAMQGREVVVLEAERGVGRGVSSRNSEVIHAGLYYSTGSLKARLCVEGRRRLYQFCKDFGVEHRRLGKIIVATSDAEAARLAAIRARAEANGVDDLKTLSKADLGALEPELEGVLGLLSPSSGIIDAHGLMTALHGALEAAGGVVAFDSPVISGRAGEGLTTLKVGGAAPTTITAERVILCGGLSASALAASIEGLARASIPKTRFAKGAYFSLARRSPFARLVYPVPESGGLGVHLTLDLLGQARFGPDVEWLDETDPKRLNYDVDPARAARFTAAIRRYWPGLKDGELAPAYVGVRPKLSAPGAPDADFMIHGPEQHGAEGVIALYGIESPGLTSALAIGEEVARRVKRGS